MSNPESSIADRLLWRSRNPATRDRLHGGATKELAFDGKRRGSLESGVGDVAAIGSWSFAVIPRQDYEALYARNGFSPAHYLVARMPASIKAEPKKRGQQRRFSWE